MKILVALTYYHPHVSGLTRYAERLGAALVRRGHEVTVLTSRHLPELPREETRDGVRIVRVPVAFALGKGLVQPGLPAVAHRLLKEHDALHLHLPQAEAGFLALIARSLGKRVLVTYHCDLLLPPGSFNRIAAIPIKATHALAGGIADTVVAYTRDFADHSPFLRRWSKKVTIVPPPVEVEPPESARTESYRHKWGTEGRKVVGFAGRFAADKGLEYLVEAIPEVAARIPSVKFLFAGPTSEVIGETVWQRLRPTLEKLGDRIGIVGTLSPSEIASFYSLCDVLVLPSVNSTESFGLVQAEAMLCGTPVVASALPGVRETIRLTGMGELIPPRDAGALARALVTVIEGRRKYARPAERIRSLFSPEATADAYEKLFTAARPISGVRAA